jgi:integrase
MGTVFRRSFRDKRSGKLKKVKTYSIKYKGPDGEWITEATDATQRPVAERLLLQREREVQRSLGGDLPAIVSAAPLEEESPAVRLEELIDPYLSWFRYRARPYTLLRREEYLRGTLARLPAQAVIELKLPAVHTYVEGRLATGIAESTVNCEVRYLRHVLAWALDQELIPANPLAKWKPLREKPIRQRRALAPGEVQRLLAVAPLHRRVVWAVFLAGGVRRSELIQLLIGDLDLDHSILIIRPEVSKTGKLRRIFFPEGVTSLLRDYLAGEERGRRQRLDGYLAEVRGRLARYEAAGQGNSPKAEGWRHLEQLIVANRNHQYLFVNGRGLPIPRNNNLLRSLRADLRKAKVDLAHLDLHALRKTCNTTLLKGGVNPAIIRARLGHSSASMTELYTDAEALDQGGHTEPVAGLLGMPAGTGPANDGEEGRDQAQATPLATPPGEGPLRPTPGLLAALVERFSNILIARICQVSEAAVRKWLKAAGIIRAKRCVSTEDVPAWLVALLRADLRAALAREAN